jgi:hypothetical protein
LNKKTGDSHAVRTGVLTAAAAVVFWPAAPAFLLMKGKDITINKGVTFDTFTDADHVLKGAPGTPAVGPATALNAMNASSGSGNVTITSNPPGADIEIDGAYVGSTPTTLAMSAGPHQISVKSGTGLWQRNLQVSAGSTVTVNAHVQESQVVSHRTR